MEALNKSQLLKVSRDAANVQSRKAAGPLTSVIDFQEPF
jgi:hypothetical protein